MLHILECSNRYVYEYMHIHTCAYTVCIYAHTCRYMYEYVKVIYIINYIYIDLTWPWHGQSQFLKCKILYKRVMFHSYVLKAKKTNGIC